VSGPPSGDTIAKVRALLARFSGVPAADIGMDQPLSANAHDGGLDLDSLDRIELAIGIGEEFGFDIPDDHVDRPELGTMGGLAAYVEGRLERQPA
jgi:acyl carrier protein